jgi:hypothetical protein
MEPNLLNAFIKGVGSIMDIGGTSVPFEVCVPKKTEIFKETNNDNKNIIEGI